MTGAGAIDILGAYRARGGVFGRTFCSSPHPSEPDVYCRRFPDHPDEHAAYVFKISEPDRWR